MLRRLLFSALVLCTGCVSLPIGSTQVVPSSRFIRRLPNDDARCMRLATAADSPYRVRLEARSEEPVIADGLGALPPDVLRTVRAAGLETALERLLAAAEADPARETLSYLARRQAVALHVGALESQLRSTVFEIDCLDDHLERMISDIEGRGSTRETRITIASVALASVGAVVAGSFELRGRGARAPHIIGIASGATGGVLGLAALGPGGLGIIGRERHGAYLEHPRNLLTPVFEGTDPEHVYPTFLFRLLLTPDARGRSPRDDVLERFDAFLREHVEPDELEIAEALLYGTGGVYDARLLHVREQMLDELELVFAAFARDLELLQRWLTLRFDEAGPGAE